MTVFFRLTSGRSEIYGEKNYAGASVTRLPVSDGNCPACGRERKAYRRAQFAEVGAGGKVWPLTMSSDGGLLFHERTLEIFEEEDLTGFTPYPVSFEKIKSKALRLQPTPIYYFLGVEGGLKFDPTKARDLTGYCDECGGTAAYDGLGRFIPRMETYNGADFFKFINHPGDLLFCSLRAVEVFRKHRIDNLQVQPLDLLWNDDGRGDIDYLGPAWPPERWYPLPRSHGRTREEWFDLLIRNGKYAGYEPLMDFLPEILGDLIETAEHGSELERWNALRALKQSHYRGQPVPEHLLQLAESMGPGLPESILRQLLFTGNDRERDNAAYHLTQLRQKKRIKLSDREREAILKLLLHMSPSALD